MSAVPPPPTRCAIVGCGLIADAHAAAIAATRGAQLVAGVDPAPTARARAEAAWGCPTFSSIDGMLRALRVDVACVCSPPVTHRRIVEELLAAGVHVLCEKPLATTATDAAALVRAAHDHSAALAVSAKFRFVEDLLEARRLIEAGAIGEPVYYEVTFCARVPMAGRWNVQPELSGGGVVMDNAPHALDVLATVLDSPIAGIRAAFSRSAVDPSVEDTAELQIKTERGTLGRIALSWTYFTKDLDYLVVQGTHGGIRVAWTGGLQRRHGERDWTPFGRGYDKAGAFGQQLQAFLGLARGETDAAAFGDPVGTISLIEDAYRSARTERWRRTRITQPGWRPIPATAR